MNDRVARVLFERNLGQFFCRMPTYTYNKMNIYKPTVTRFSRKDYYFIKGIATNLDNVADEIKNKRSAQLQKTNDEALPPVKKFTVIIVA